MKTIEELKNILLLSDFFKLRKSLDEYNVCEHDKFGNNITHENDVNKYFENIKEAK
jgi:hypothetical protein